MAHRTLSQSWKRVTRSPETGGKQSCGDRAGGFGRPRGPRSRNSVIPDIRMSGEHAVLERLGGHPAHRQQPLPALPVIVGLVDVPGHAEIWEADRRQESQAVGAALGGQAKKRPLLSQRPRPRAQGAAGGSACKLLGSSSEDPVTSHVTHKHPESSAPRHTSKVLLLKS